MEALVLPPNLEKFAGKNLPANAKMMTAKGMSPLQPKDLITCVYAVSLDADPEISRTANETLKGFPENIAKTAVESGLAPQVLDGLARQSDHQGVLEAIGLFSQTEDETLCFLAETGSTRIVEIISNNQIRLLKSPEIMDSLGKNPLTGPAVLDRIFSFLQREGVIPTESETTDGQEISVDEFTAGLEDYDLPEDFDFPEDLIEDLGEEMEEEEAKNLFAKICNMKIMEKIKLALLGNKEARSILIRDPNKLVSSAVIKSPKIGENEIIAIVKSRAVGDNVLRLIHKKKEWRRIYNVQLALATNPKTPFDIALRMLKMLRANDMSKIAKSKGVPAAVATAAKRIISVKR